MKSGAVCARIMNAASAVRVNAARTIMVHSMVFRMDFFLPVAIVSVNAVVSLSAGFVWSPASAMVSVSDSVERPVASPVLF